MNQRDVLMQEFPELADALHELPENVRLVDSDRSSAPARGLETRITLYVEVDEKLYALSYTRFDNGFASVDTEELDPL